MTYFAPPVELHGNTDQQISDIYTYLFKLAAQLNLSFERTTPAAIFEEVNKAIEHADSGKETDKVMVDNYQQLKALVIKTADYTGSFSGGSWDVLGKVNELIDASAATLSGEISNLSDTLGGRIDLNDTAIGTIQNYVDAHGADFFAGYVAVSDFGTYAEATAADISANSTGITQMYEYAASLGILGNGESDVDITDIETWTQAYIKSGLLYYDNASPKYGVAVGNVDELVTIDGHEVINRQNLLATFTADRLSFWQSGNEVAYLSSGSMYFPSAHISGGSIEIGGSESGGQHVTGPFYVDNVGNLVASSATISGTLTAQSGSQLGNWSVNTAIYNGKTSLSDTSHSGIYIGTDGIYLGNGQSTETYVKMLPDGTLTANSATITGDITASKLTIANNATVSGLSGSHLASNSVTATQLANNTITASQIANGTITATQIANGTITTTQIASGTITADNIASATITAAKIKSGTITATQIASATITANEIAGNTITAAEIAAGAVNTSELAAGAVTTAKLDAGAVTAAKIAAGTITAAELAAGCVTAAKLAAMSITADKIKLYGDMTVYTTSSGTTSGGSLGYFTGFTGEVTTAGIGMKAASGGGQVACTSAGASIRCGSTNLGEVWATAGSVGLRAKYGTDSSIIYYGYNSTDSMFAFRPSSNGSLPLGSPSNKWSVLYASSSTINTSDRQVKHDISYNIDNYEALFDDLKPVKYKYDNGTSNRYHTGFISQDIEDSLLRLGMSSQDFAAFIKSPIYDDNNESVIGYNYALRYEEIIALAVLKIKKLEQRIAALEGA